MFHNFDNLAQLWDACLATVKSRNHSTGDSAVPQTTMLTSTPVASLSDFDQRVFDTVVPPDHYLRQVAAAVDFERFRPRLAEAYCPDRGRPAIDPVRMLKILFLRYH